jgi:hypothetical protein
MKIAYRTSATYFVYLQTNSDRDGRWLLGRMRLTWPLSIAKEEGVGRARHAVFVLLLAPLCAGAVRTASACFLSRFVRLAAWSCRQPVPGGAGPFDPGRPGGSHRRRARSARRSPRRLAAPRHNAACRCDRGPPTGPAVREDKTGLALGNDPPIVVFDYRAGGGGVQAANFLGDRTDLHGGACLPQVLRPS